MGERRIRASRLENKGRATTSVLTALLLVLSALLPILAVPTASAVTNRTSSIVGNFEQSGVFAVSGEAPPMSADLAFDNDTASTSKLANIATSLHNSPLQIFLYVRNSIYFEPYEGSMKGAYQTYATSAGNDIDQASLLITLLRLSNIPARYVLGNIVLTPGEVQNWVGFPPLSSNSSTLTLTMANQSAEVLTEAGIPFHYRYGIASEPSSILFTISHVWVEAYVNSTWVQMDPSFKQYLYYTPVDWPSVLDSGPGTTATANSSQEETLLNYFNSSFFAYVAQKENLRIGNLTGGHQIINSTAYSLPMVTDFVSSTPSLADNMRWFIGVSFPTYDSSSGNFTFTRNTLIHLPTTLLGTSHLSVYGLPNNSTLDYVKSFAHGIYDPSIDLSKILLRPCLLFEGKNLIIGGDSPFGVTMPVAVVVAFNNTVQETGVMHYVVGQYAVLATSLGHNWANNEEILGNIAEQYGSAITGYESGQMESLDSLLGERLLFTSSFYFALTDALTRPLEGYLDVVQVAKVSVASISFTLNVLNSGGRIARAVPGGFTLDVFLNGHSGGVQLQADLGRLRLFNLLDGCLGSYIEGVSVASQDQGVPLSTVSLLYYATLAKIPIVLFTPQNFTQATSRLNLPGWVVSELAPFINRGYWVAIPSLIVDTSALRTYVSSSPMSPSPTPTWNGTAYITFDPQTYASGYYISGELTSGSASSKVLTFTGGQEGTPGNNDPFFSQMTGSQNEVLPSTGGLDAQCNPQSGSPAGGNQQGQAQEQVQCGSYGMTDRNSCNSVTNAADVFTDSNGNPIPLGAGYGGIVVNTDANNAVAVDTAPNNGVDNAPNNGMTFAESLQTIWNWSVGIVKGVFRTTAASGALGLPQDPQLNSYLSDSSGERSGYNQGSYTTLFLTQSYNASASGAQLFLYEVPTGTYDLSIVNSGASSTTAYGALVASSAGHSETTAFGPVSLGPGVTMRAPVKVSYVNGMLTTTIGGFLPASFITLERPNHVVVGSQLSISGRLTGSMGNNSLGSKQVTISYRPSGSITADWVTIGITNTFSDGTFVYSWNVSSPVPSPVGTIDLRASYAGDGSNYQSSAIVTTYVATRLAVDVSSVSNSPIAGVNVTLFGTLGSEFHNLTMSNGEATFLLPETRYGVWLPNVGQLGLGKRAVFMSWDNGLKSTNRTINLSVPTKLTSVFELQNLVTARYSIFGGGNPTPPNLSGVSMGSRVTYILNETSSQIWLDSGSEWSTPALLRSGTAMERWITSTATNGTISVAFALSTSYQHQYYVRTTATAGGLVSPSSGWYSSSQTLQISASPDAGWKLGIWNALGAGSYSGESNSVTLTVNGPINQTAVFYPGLSIQVSGGGSVQYNYGDTTGTVSGGNTTIYVPPGANVQLSASPSMFLYQFNGWNGATTSKSSAVSFSLNSPLSAQASFSFNYLNLSIIGALAIATLLIGSLAVMRRTRGGSGPTGPSTATQTIYSPPPVLPKAAGPPTQDLLCPTCHNPVVRGEPFCPTCGTKLGLGQNFCRRCGHPVSPQAQFCNQCGNRLS